MNKKNYISPEFEIIRVEIYEDVIMASLESSNGNTVIAGDDWDSWGNSDEDW